MRLIEGAQDDSIRDFPAEIMSFWSLRQTYLRRCHLGKKGPNLKDSYARSCQGHWNIIALLGQPEGNSQAPD